MNNIPYQILSSKITRPKLPDTVIARPQIIEKLDQALSKKLILISASAGYGKTTSANLWTRALDKPVAWLTLDRTDNNPTRFFSYLYYAIQKGNPSIELNKEIFNRDQELFDEAGINSLTNYLNDKIENMIFIIDEYHLIENPIIHRALRILIENRRQPESDNQNIGYLPLILTRTNPPFPLARWQIQNDLLEITTDDLRLSIQEAQEFIRNSMTQQISDADIDIIHKKTEGWIAGLQMASISYHKSYLKNTRRFIQEFNGCNPLIVDYMMSEIVASLPVPISDFLFETSILDRMSVPLCDAIRKKKNSRKIIDTLIKNNLFIISLDNQQIWFRYHRLLSDYLTQRKIEAGDAHEAHSQAARWLKKYGYYQESIRHYLEAQQPDHAVEAVSEIAFVLISQGKPYQLGDLLDDFQDEHFSEYPWLCIFRAWKEAILDSGQEEFWLEKAKQKISEHSLSIPTSSIEIEQILENLMTIRIFSTARRGEDKIAEKQISKAYEIIPDRPSLNRGIVNYSEGIWHFIRGDLDKAQKIFENAKITFIKSRNFAMAADVIGLLSELLIIRGCLHLAQGQCQDAISLIKPCSEKFMPSYRSYSGLGDILYEWNAIDEAFTNLEQGFLQSKAFGVSAQIYSGTALVNAYINIGNYEKARFILQELDYLPKFQINQPLVESKLIANWIRWYSARKDFREAERLIDERNIGSIDDTDIVREPERMSLVYYYLMANDMSSVITLAEHLCSNMLKKGRTSRYIRVLIMQVVACSFLGQHEAALSKLIQALETGKSEGYIRSFVDYGDEILQLLIEISRNGEKYSCVDMDYVRKIIMAFFPEDISTAKNQQIQWKIEQNDLFPSQISNHPLTHQELKILMLIAFGYDNTQIATNQHITKNTVKTHISHIFSKLGVRNRVEAVNRAKVLGIIR